MQWSLIRYVMEAGWHQCTETLYWEYDDYKSVQTSCLASCFVKHKVFNIGTHWTTCMYLYTERTYRSGIGQYRPIKNRLQDVLDGKIVIFCCKGFILPNNAMQVKINNGARSLTDYSIVQPSQQSLILHQKCSQRDVVVFSNLPVTNVTHAWVNERFGLRLTANMMHSQTGWPQYLKFPGKICQFHAE